MSLDFTEGERLLYSFSSEERDGLVANGLPSDALWSENTPVEFIGESQEDDSPTGPDWVAVRRCCDDPDDPESVQIVHRGSLSKPAAHAEHITAETVEKPAEGPMLETAPGAPEDGAVLECTGTDEDRATIEQAAATATLNDPPPMLPGDPDEPKPDAQAIVINGRSYTGTEIEAIMSKDRRGRELAAEISAMEAQATADQAALNDLRQRIKDKHKTLTEHAIQDPQTRLDFGHGNGSAASSEDEKDDRDPAILTPSERGRQAAQRAQTVNDCPYDESYPDWRAEWMAAFEAESNSIANAQPWRGRDREISAQEAGLTADQLAELYAKTASLTWTTNAKEIPKLDAQQKAVELHGVPHLVVDELTESEGYALAPLYRKDDWPHEELIGKPVKRSNAPEMDDYQVHGVLCGRVVKGAKGANLIIGPEIDYIHVLTEYPIGQEPPDKGAAEDLFAEDQTEAQADSAEASDVETEADAEAVGAEV